MIRLKLSAILWLLLPLSAIAQQYTAADIKIKADAALRKLLNEDIFQHCVFSNGSYYGYKDNKGELQWGTLEDKVLKGKPITTGVCYTLDYKYSKCRLYDSIGGRIFLDFNENWALTNTPNLKFIPDFMLKGEPCRFISKKEALQIAINNGRKTDPHTMGGLRYVEDSKQFVWEFFHTPTKEEMAPPSDDYKKTSKDYITQFQEWEIFIDAETGALLDNDKILLGHRGPFRTSLAIDED